MCGFWDVRKIIGGESDARVVQKQVEENYMLFLLFVEIQEEVHYF